MEQIKNLDIKLRNEMHYTQRMFLEWQHLLSGGYRDGVMPEEALIAKSLLGEMTTNDFGSLIETYEAVVSGEPLPDKLKELRGIHYEYSYSPIIYWAIVKGKRSWLKGWYDKDKTITKDVFEQHFTELGYSTENI